MSEILKEIVAYFLFLMLLLLVAYGNRDPNTYLLRKTLHETFVDLDQLSVDLADVSIYHAFSSKYIEDITRWREDMDFMFEWPREHKIHIFEPTCNVLFIIWRLNIEQKQQAGNRDVIEGYDTHKGDIRKIRHSGPG